MGAFTLYVPPASSTRQHPRDPRAAGLDSFAQHDVLANFLPRVPIIGGVHRETPRGHGVRMSAIEEDIQVAIADPDQAGGRRLSGRSVQLAGESTHQALQEGSASPIALGGMGQPMRVPAALAGLQ